MAIDQSSANGIGTAFAGNAYFSTQSKQADFLGITSTPYVVLKPSGTGVVDVYKDMYWANLGSKEEVPQVYIIEKQLKYGTWAAQLANLIIQGSNVATSQDVDSFLKLYAAENTGFYYNFPWLLKSGDNLRTVENTWNATQGMGDFFKSAIGSSKGSLGTAMGAVGGAVLGSVTPGFGFEATKQYDSTSAQTLRITFPLYNTIDLESSFKHFSFVNLFTFQNLKTRTSLMSYIPPKIYEVDAYSVGGIYMAAAVVSNLQIDSIGTTRRMSDWQSFGPKEILLPEAYRITITFTDLLSQSSNVFAGALGGTKINVTDAVELDNFIENNIGPPLQSVTNLLGDAANTARNSWFGNNNNVPPTTNNP
jgi:hypothetical protein